MLCKMRIAIGVGSPPITTKNKPQPKVETKQNQKLSPKCFFSVFFFLFSSSLSPFVLVFTVGLEQNWFPSYSKLLYVTCTIHSLVGNLIETQ